MTTVDLGYVGIIFTETVLKTGFTMSLTWLPWVLHKILTPYMVQGKYFLPHG